MKIEKRQKKSLQDSMMILTDLAAGADCVQIL